MDAPAALDEVGACAMPMRAAGALTHETNGCHHNSSLCGNTPAGQGILCTTSYTTWDITCTTTPAAHAGQDILCTTTPPPQEHHEHHQHVGAGHTHEFLPLQVVPCQTQPVPTSTGTQRPDSDDICCMRLQVACCCLVLPGRHTTCWHQQDSCAAWCTAGLQGPMRHAA